MSPQIRPFRDGIIGLAIGDMLGAPVEFGERWMRDEDPVKGPRSGGIFDLPRGAWTDDTSMTLATLYSLKTGFSPQDLMCCFLAWLRTGDYTLNGEAIGIGKQILRSLEHYEAHGDLTACGGIGERDNGNGSLMRILPVCLYAHARNLPTGDAIRMVHDASGLTHNHPRSKIACGLYYFLTAAMLDESGPLHQRLQAGLDRGFAHYHTDELRHFDRVRSAEALRQLPRDEIRSSGYVVDSFEAALWCLVTEDSFETSLLKAVNLGLDTDTIAAIAGGLAGLYYGYDQIPAEWRSVLLQRAEIEALCAEFDAMYAPAWKGTVNEP